MMNRTTLAGLLLMSFVLSGCLDSVPPAPKEDLVPVSGTVKVGGTPTEGVLVAFVPSEGTSGQGSSAVTDSAGHYELVHNASKKPGVPVGKYTVTFSKWVMPDGSPAPKDQPPHRTGAKNLIPTPRGGQGAGAQGSTVDVPAGGTTRDFDLPS
jgi:hypothetical protein